MYFVDSAFITFLSIKFSENFGRLMENTVFIELLRRGKEVNYALGDNWEIDFVLPDEETLIQVSYDVSNPETMKRKLRALKKVRKLFHWKKAVLVTWDAEKKVDGIKIVPLWGFLLEGY